MSDDKYDNNMQGVLFQNDKGDVPTRADYRGECEVAGVKYWLDAWFNLSKGGTKRFLKLKFKPKGAPSPVTSRVPAMPPASTRTQYANDFNDDIPF